MYDVGEMRETITRDPVYGILNLCRVLGFLQEGKVMSKTEAATWALNNIREDMETLVSRTLEIHQSESSEKEEWDDRMLKDYADYMLNEIESLRAEEDPN